jgi:hypothetical protein
MGDLLIATASHRAAFDIGEEVKFVVTARRPCYLTLLDFGTSGGVTVILPNRYSQTCYLRAGETLLVPGPEHGFSYQIAGPPGQEHVLAIGTTKPLLLEAPQLRALLQSSKAPFFTVPVEHQEDFVRSVRDILVVEKQSAEDFLISKCSFVIREHEALHIAPDALAQPESPPEATGSQVDAGTVPLAPGVQAEPVPPSVPAGERWAIAIGVASYPPPRKLLFAAADARTFSMEACDLLGVPKQNRRLITESKATLDGLRSAIREIACRASPNDTLYLYFSGHGTTEPDDDGDEADGLDECLVLFPDALLRDDELFALVNQTWCGRRVLFLDCCFAAGAVRGIKGVGLPRPRAASDDGFGLGEGAAMARGGENFSLPPGYFVMAASQPDEPSFEDIQVRHGVFTYYLLQGLRGEADQDRNGEIHLTELYNYLERVVPEHVRRMPTNTVGLLQRPCLIGAPGFDMSLRP